MKPGVYENLPVDEQAAHWLAVMENPTRDEETAFWCWIGSSPNHVREMMLAGKLDRELESFDRPRTIDVEALLARADAEGRPRRPWHRRAMLAAAAGVAVLGCAIILYTTFGAAGDRYSTKVGEQREIKLEDGSTMVLNTRTTADVDYSAGGRDIFLRGGQALFNVRHDASRPFRVHAAQSTIEAVGTRFDVQLSPDHTTVAVLEGAVQLSATAEAGTGAQRLSAGQAATVGVDGRIGERQPIDRAATIAWRQRQLVFKGEPLGRIVEEFNRYNATPRLRIEGNELRERKFVGVFDADDPQDLLDYLAQDPRIRFERSGDEVVIEER